MGAVWMMGLFEGVKGVNKKVLVKVICLAYVSNNIVHSKS